MRSKLILFCALLFCSKFVGSVPFGEETGRQRAYQQNNWQGNENVAGQYHGNDFARTQNSNSMSNSAQQYTNGQSNQERQYNNNYGFNNHPSSLESLPMRNNPENFGSATNERRSGGFQIGGDNYLIRNQNQPIRSENQYRQQNWQSQNQFANAAVSAISSAATVNKKPLQPVPEPYHNLGQHLQLPQANRQHYQSDGLYPGNREINYHPLVEKPDAVKYGAHSGSNFGVRPGNVHYENFNGPHAHNINISKLGNNVYPSIAQPYPGPSNSQVPQVNNAGNSYNNGPIIPINTGYSNGNNENVEHPIISPGPNNYNEGHVHNINTVKPGNIAYLGNSPPYSGPPHGNYNRPPSEPIHTRYNNGNNENVPKPIILPGLNNYPANNNYVTPGVPSYPALNANQPRYFNNPIINSGPDDQPLNYYGYRENPVINPSPLNNAPVNTFDNENSGLTDTVLYNNANNDEGYPKPANNNEEPFIPNDSDKALEGTYNESAYEPDSSDSYSPGDQDNENDRLFYFPEGKSIKNFFLNKLQKHFIIIHPNGTAEYVHHLNSDDKPNYIIVKKNYEQPRLSQPTKKSGTDGVQYNPNILDALSNKTDHALSPVIQNDNDYNKSSNENDYDSSVPRSQTTQVTTSSPLLQSTTPTYSYQPQYNWPHNNRNSPDHQYWNPVLPSTLHTSITSTTTATSLSPDDELTDFIESLSHKNDDKNAPPKDDQDHSTLQTERPSDDYYPHDHRRPTTPFFSTPKPESNNNYPYNNHREPHHSYWNHRHPQLPSKSYTSSTTTTSTPSPDDIMIEEFLKSLSHKHDDTNRPPKSDEDDSISQTDRPSDDSYPHDHRQSQTTDAINPEGNNYYPYNQNWHNKHPPKGQRTSITSSPNNNDDDDDDVKENNGNYDSPKLITKISPGIYPSTTSDSKGNKHYPHKFNPETIVQYDKPDDNSSQFIPNSQFPKDNNDYPEKSNPDTFNPYESQMHHFLDDIHDKPRQNYQNDKTLPIISTRKDDQTVNSRDQSSIVSISPTESTPVDEIITLSQIELATDNVKDGFSPSPLDEGIIDNDNLDAIKYQSTVDEVKTPYYPSTPIIDQNDDNTDNGFIPILEGSDETVIKTKDIVINDTKSACIDSFTNTDVPAKSDDNKAAVINQNDVNTDDTSSGDISLESEQTSGLTLKLNVPNDFDDTLYIDIDVPDSNTGNEDKLNDDTVYVHIKRQNNSDTDSTTANKDQSNDTRNKNMMIDLSSALVVTNGTTDKDFMTQLLSGESKVNMFIFQMPSQEGVLVEKSKHTTLFCNGTCLIETIEKTWKTKDDPTPSVISTKIFSKGDKCQLIA